MKNEKKVVVSADKTSNHFAMETYKYKDLLKKSINKDYKKSNNDFVDAIIKDDKVITEKLEISERVYKTQKRSAFVTVKDHKPNYQNNTKCRLLNRAKSDIGKISKKKLEKIVNIGGTQMQSLVGLKTSTKKPKHHLFSSTFVTFIHLSPPLCLKKQLNLPRNLSKSVMMIRIYSFNHGGLFL